MTLTTKSPNAIQYAPIVYRAVTSRDDNGYLRVGGQNLHWQLIPTNCRHLFQLYDWDTKELLAEYELGI